MVYIVEDDVQTMRAAASAMMEAFGKTAKSIHVAVGKLAAGKPMAEGFSGSYRVRNRVGAIPIRRWPVSDVVFPSSDEAGMVGRSSFVCGFDRRGGRKLPIQGRTTARGGGLNQQVIMAQIRCF